MPICNNKARIGDPLIKCIMYRMNEREVCERNVWRLINCRDELYLYLRLYLYFYCVEAYELER